MSDKYPGGFITDGAPAGFSVAFGATTSKLSIASMTALGSDFTIECWIYPTSFADYNTIFDNRSSDVDASGCVLGLTSANKVYFYTNSTFQLTTTTALVANKWTHIALVRSGSSSGNCKIYINGVADATTATYTTSFSRTAASIGDDWNTRSNLQFFGYISNFRTLTTALYTTTFTPPTQLFPVTSTTLLTCQSPTIIDTSSSAVAITLAGSTTPTVSTFTPFAAYTGFNPALGAAAGGVWTLDEAAYYQNNRQWPIYDPYFNNTTLMLHGNGTNGAQNNTFLDSSTNNFTITRNGNTTQGTFTPFSQTGWSYNGTAGAYCQLNNADYAIGTGDFTIEFWMYCVDDSSYGSSAFAGLPGGGVLTVSMSGGSSNARQPYLEFGGTSVAFGTLYGYLNRWTHIAYVRTSGYVVVYQNGVATAAPISKSQSFPNCANLYLARLPTDTGQDFRGYLSNFRITKAAVYSSNFTPSTQPLTAITSTQLLTFQDNRFVDNSANNSTVTPAGTASVQAFSPFVPTTSTPITYSNWFDGTGDYLSSSTSTNLDLNGAIDFTIEAWVYVTAWGSTADLTYRVVGKFSPASVGYMYGMFGGGASQGKPSLYGGSGGAINFTATNSVPLNAWMHIAVVKNGTTFTHYLNGVANGSTTTSSTFGTVSDPLTIGNYYNTAYTEMFKGCISNLRIVKGTALYTAAFTPPTAPLTNITNTSLLTCQSSTFIDNSSNAFTVTANGNVQPVASPNPFGFNTDQSTLNTAYSATTNGGSGYFDGSGDYLSITNATAFDLSGDFTIELWYYPTAFPNTYTVVFSTDVADAFQLAFPSSAIEFYFNGSLLISASYTRSSLLNAWHHIAISRSGSSVALFLDGVRLNTGTSSASPNNGALYIGYQGAGTSWPTSGYISGLRLVKGAYVYNPSSTTYTIPTSPLTNITNTELLLNFTNGGIIDSTGKNVLETVGNAQISTTQSKYGGSSMYFDGTGDYLTAYNNGLFKFYTGDFTIEAWIYPTYIGAFNNIFFTGDNSTSQANLRLNSGKVEFFANDSAAFTLTGATTLTINNWYHIAFCRSGSSNKIFINGVQDASATNSYSYTGSGLIQIGSWSANGSSYQYAGYIDDLRVTRYARYTANFTPPTSQLQDQ